MYSKTYNLTLNHILLNLKYFFQVPQLRKLALTMSNFYIIGWHGHFNKISITSLEWSPPQKTPFQRPTSMAADGWEMKQKRRRAAKKRKIGKCQTDFRCPRGENLLHSASFSERRTTFSDSWKSNGEVRHTHPHLPAHMWGAMGDGWREREIGERGESEKTHSHSVGIFINRKFRAKVLPFVSARKSSEFRLPVQWYFKRYF